MKKVLVICDPQGDTRLETEPLLARLSGISATYAEMKDLVLAASQQAHFDAAIFDCRALDLRGLSNIQRLTRFTNQGPLLILANQIMVYWFSQIEALKNAVTLQKPFDRAVFTSLLERVSSGLDFKPKVCPRFITDEEVRMVVMDTGLLIPTRMRNYSAGGAFFEYKGISLKVGDEVQMSLRGPGLKGAPPTFQVHAKVVWIRKGEHTRSAVRGVGVQFLSL